VLSSDELARPAPIEHTGAPPMGNVIHRARQLMRLAREIRSSFSELPRKGLSFDALEPLRRRACDSKLRRRRAQGSGNIETTANLGAHGPELGRRSRHDIAP